MSLILARRYQQGIFQAAAATNRFDGTAGMGAGVSVANQPTSAVHGGNGIGAPGQVFSSAAFAWTPIADGNGTPMAITINASHTQTWLFLGNLVLAGPTAGSQSAFVELFLDGVVTADGGGPLAGPFYGYNGAIGGQATMPVLYSTQLAPGVHVLDARIQIANSGTSYTVFSFDLYAFQMN